MSVDKILHVANCNVYLWRLGPSKFNAFIPFLHDQTIVLWFNDFYEARGIASLCCNQ